MAASAELSSPPALGSFTAELFTELLATQAGSPAWWLERKRAAFARFAALPMPVRTDEAWRFSNLAGLKLDGFSLQPGSAASLSGADLKFAPNPSLIFVNNRQIRAEASLSPVTGAPPSDSTVPVKMPANVAGVIVSTLSEAAQRHPELLKAHFMAQPQKLGSEKFAALHAAFAQEGAFIYVPRGVEVREPIVVVHAAAGAGAAVFPHTLVIAEENSRVTVVDYFVSATAEPHFACGANDFYAGHGAQITYVGVQNWSRESLSLQLNSTVVRRDARVQSLNVHLGARQARHESLSQLQAPGAFSEMLALTIARGKAEFDQRTLQLHQAPNTKSDLLYKNALRDAAKTIFSGLIIVDPDAQKTDAYQSNRNLVLSDDAEADSLPGLEIHANDVRCTHGATTSRVDPEQLFYLQSRGISPERAHELLVFGFFEEVLSRLESEPLHAALTELIQSQFQP